MLTIKIFWVLYFPLTVILALDYCKLCKRESHTLCKYKEGPSFRCLDYKKPEFTTSVKKYIVDIHNDIRNHVASGQETRGALGRQPSASNMNILAWDNELAEIAQRWADQCIGLNENIQHDDCRKTERFEVGQNILTAVTPSLEIPEIAILILNWYKQVESVLPSDIESFSGIQRGKFLIGQYTQLIWAETRYFGCGMSTFKNDNSSQENYRYLHRLVCNYGPRGNLIGTSVYERGIPCSKCPLGKCDSIRTSLCEGVQELNNVSEKYNGIVYAEKFAQYNVYIPTYLFNTVSLGYILKNNLTEFVYNVLQNINSRNQEIKCFIKNLTEISDPEPFFSLSPNTPEKEIQENKYSAPKIRHQDYFKPIQSPLSSKNMKKMADLLNHNEHINQFDHNIYELEEGIIVVDDCKHHAHLSQYEDVLATETVPDNAEILLPNNIVYKKLKGIWFHGSCRCNYVYRSGKEGSSTIFLAVHDPEVFKWIKIIGEPLHLQRHFDGDTCSCLYRVL